MYQRCIHTIQHGSLQRDCIFRKHQLAGSRCFTHKLEGDPGSATTTAEAMWQGKNLPKSHRLVNPRVIFPWRHETELLPRLIPSSEEHIQEGGYFGPGMPTTSLLWRTMFMYVAGGQLGVPWIALPFSGWKQEFAESSSWAFSQAVAAVMSDLHRVPFEEIRKENGDFDVDFNHTTTTPIESLDEKLKSSSFDLDSMMDEKLLKMYEFAHASGREQMQIRLQMQPTSAELQSIFIVPFSREELSNDPLETRSLASIKELFYAELDRDSNHYEYTMIAQVLVYCDEVFRVTDLKCGTLLQGHADGQVRRVPHLVRLEAVMKYNMKEKTSNVVHGWQITDWDDLLDGNLWFKAR